MQYSAIIQALARSVNRCFGRTATFSRRESKKIYEESGTRLEKFLWERKITRRKELLIILGMTSITSWSPSSNNVYSHCPDLMHSQETREANFMSSGLFCISATVDLNCTRPEPAICCTEKKNKGAFRLMKDHKFQFLTNLTANLR